MQLALRPELLAGGTDAIGLLPMSTVGKGVRTVRDAQRAVAAVAFLALAVAACASSDEPTDDDASPVSETSASTVAEDTVPPPPGPEEAPWDTAPVEPTPDLESTAQSWAESGFDGCELYAPTGIPENLGYETLGPNYTRFGNLDLFWGDEAGGSAGVSIWPAESTEVLGYFSGEPAVVYADGSELRTAPEGGEQRGLISIPDQSCFYEIFARNLSAWGTVLDSFRPIEVADIPTAAPAVQTPAPGAACELGSHDDCIDPDGDGQGTYLIGGAECIATFAPLGSVGLCSDLDGDGQAGYPDSG